MKRFVIALALCGAPLSAHEFWIDPLATQVAPGGVLAADIRVGQELKGAAYSYVPPNFRRFDIVMGDQMLPVDGRAGDKPALNMAAPTEGLAVVVHVTKDYRLTYDSWEKFENFCKEKDFAWALDAHLARGLSRDKVREQYSRHAKSLIGVGDGAGADRAMGLEVELVALANPYTDDLSAGFAVQALYQGKPQAEMQVEVFDRAPDGSVTTRQYRTDDAGRAVLDVAPGHFYLVDHVVMRELTPGAETDPAWESLWASLTFGVPQ
ncbi:DUF4198 domain-containing protein [Tropicibacter oceani]|uniref:DUF4198 domain-containing protein n=1 Tax=Tropicibacter oceani TaxID=3058420 RepID=A0ABY8QNX4_9RHOB|nr:DUF4198 domain-containing protein [Tropicibacter oceani]WGW05532.1 DUF4198 domain-containing protein [Tropicibacter oceani]